jgi:hypothetical protein
VLTTFDSTATATVFSTTTASTATVINGNTVVSSTTETVEVTTIPTILATTIVTDVSVLTVPSTVVLPTVTDTTTVTLVPRQVTIAPSDVPTYASACSGTVRYSSACSCIGVTYSTITVAAPTTTETTTIDIVDTASTTVQSTTTVQDLSLTTIINTSPTTIVSTIIDSVISTYTAVTTVTPTVDVTATVCPATPTFYLQASGAGVTGQYAAVSSNLNAAIVFVTDISDAGLFYLNSNGNLLTSPGNLVANIANTQAETVFFNTEPDNPGPAVAELQCLQDITTTGILSCTAGQYSSNTFELCPPGTVSAQGSHPLAGVAIGTSMQSGCQAISFNAILACVLPG